jgi:hypothetical protein
MQAENGPRGLLHYTGREKVIEMSMRVKDPRHREAELLHFTENQFRRSSGVDDDGLFAHGVTDD